jgi:hypothetical protein
MVRNGYGAKYVWYEMVIVQNTYGTKWFLDMVRNCNFVVRNGKLWYEMAMVRSYSLVVLEEGGWRYKRGSDITIFFPNIAFYLC